MESVFGRYRNISILVGVVFLQVLALAVQVKRNVDDEPTRLLRIWTVSAVTPLEKGIVAAQNGIHNVWHNYFYLRGVRQENRDLKAEIERLRIEQVRLSDDAEQARRLQVLLGFKEQYISQTVPAQVIGSSGSELSRSVYIDKGARDGIKPDMPVMTADGIVGKVLRVFDSTSQVLLINDQTSGVGAILEKTRLQGVLRGSAAGEVILEKVMADETVQPGEPVLTSGGDRIFPKGLPVGTVTKVSTGAELFLRVRVKPAANLSKLEEVLVVTKVEDKEPEVEQAGPVRAIDVLADRLPSVPQKPADPKAPAAPAGSTGSTTKPANPPTNPKPQSAANEVGTEKPKSSAVVAGDSSNPANAAASPESVANKPKLSTVQAVKPGAGTVQSPAQLSGGNAVRPALQPTSGQKATPRPIGESQASPAKPAGKAASPQLQPPVKPPAQSPASLQQDEPH